jgi:Tol biopolymer transport system component
VPRNQGSFTNPLLGRMGRWITLTMVVATFLVPAPAQATYPGQNGVIAFDLDGITLINPDGTDQHALTDRGSSAAWSADGSTIYFYYAGIWSIHPDGSGLKRITLGPDSNPWPLPDGSVVFERYEGCCESDLWLKVPGRNAFRLTDAPGRDEFPTVSPDGRKIAFLRECRLAGCAYWYLMMINADGTHLRTLARDVAEGGTIDWSPDGSLVAFVRLLPNFAQGIFLFDVRTGQETRVGDLMSYEAGYNSVEFAPDGSKLLVSSASDIGDYMFTVNLDGSDLQYIDICCPGEEGLYFGQAAWQPL